MSSRPNTSSDDASRGAGSMHQRNPVLESNLELLLSRAYAPVLPAPAFRARLAHALELEIAARAAATRDPRARRMSPIRGGTRRWLVRAAAAIAFATVGVLGWKIVARGAHPGAAPGESRSAVLERIAASGRSAVCTGGSDTARAVTDRELSGGIEYAGTALTAWTARASELTVWLGREGRLLARPATRVELEGAPAAELDLSIERGAIELERFAAGGAWHVNTREGVIEIERGSMLVSMFPEASVSRAASEIERSDSIHNDGAGSLRMHARLRAGAAALVNGAERAALPLDADVEIRGGRIVAGSATSSLADGGSARTPIGGEPDVSTAAVAPKSSGTLHGVVRCASDRPLPERFTITLLRDERLPKIAQPEVHAIAGEPADAAHREFTLTGLRAGTYTVFAAAKGFATWQRRGVAISTDGAAAEVAIELDRGWRIEGRVIDADTGRAIEGAVVLSQRDAPAQVIPFDLTEVPDGWIGAAMSGPDGSFELDALSSGQHRLRATHAGYGAAWSEPLDVRSDVEKGSEPRAVVLALQRGGTVFGRVSHTDGRPWSGAFLIASRIEYAFDPRVMSFGSATTDAEGAYAIGDLPAGSYVVLNALEPSVEKVASPHVKQVNVSIGARIEVDFGGGRKGTSLEGRIVGAPPALDLAAIDVIVEPHETRPSARKWQSERARADGTFRFVDLPPGEYDVYASEEMGKSFALADVVSVPDVPRFGYELHLSMGEIRGRVADAHANGITDAVVVLEIEEFGGTRFAGRFAADAQGRYAARFLPSGVYRVTAFATTGRFAPESRSGVRVAAAAQRTNAADADSKAAESERVDIVLGPGAALEITVTGPDARPLQGAPLTFTDENGEAMHFSPEDLTDARGQFSINGIKAGRWRVSASHAGCATRTVAVELEVGAAGAIEIALPIGDQH